MCPCLLPPFSPVVVVEVIDFPLCIIYLNPPSHLPSSIMALRFVLSIMLLILAVISTLKESIVMYKVTKQWQPNHYMQQVVKDGIFYFIVYVSLFPFLSVPFITITFSRPSLKYLQQN